MLVDQPGSYLDDSTVANEAVVKHSSDAVSAQRSYYVSCDQPAHRDIRSQTNAARLWTLTEKIIGEEFTF
jgi:hypothetical protein